MTKTISLITFLLLTAGISFGDTYVWEDYDDFSGSLLNGEKWGTIYLGGGIQPYVSNGKLVLKGGVGNPTATKVVKAGWENIFQGDDGGQAWVYAKDSDIYGIEAEFIIPTNAAQSSGLAVGVASLSPFSYAGAELNADPSSTSQYSQGFGFYHLPANGGEVERFKTGQRGVTHRLSVTLTDGVIKMYVDDELQYSSNAGNFKVDMFYVYAFNDHQDSGVSFELNADNVRVLTKAPVPVTVVSTPDGKPVVVQVGSTYKWNGTLDGVTLWSVDDSGHDWQKITMKFENSRNTGDEGFYDSLTGQQPYDNPYVIDENGYIKVTETNGFQYYNVASVENGVIATLEGSAERVVNNGTNPIDQWFFTTRAAAEEFHASKASPTDLAVSPGRIRAFRDQVYLQGQNGVSVIALAGEINFDLELADKPTVSAATLSVDGSSYNLANLEAPSGFRTTFGYFSYYNELFDVESSSDSDWSPYVNGKNYAFRFVSEGHAYEYLHNLPAESAYPKAPSISIGQSVQWKGGATAGSEYVAIEADKNVTVTWDPFSSANANDFVEFNMIEMIGEDDDREILDRIQLPAGQTTYVIPSTLLEPNKHYEIYVGFANVTQAENPTGFSHAAGTDGTKPLLVTFANSLTGMAIKTLPAATKGWMWFDEYPWVYSDEEKGWLYFRSSGDKLHYWSYRDKAWREFVPKQP